MNIICSYAATTYSRLHPFSRFYCRNHAHKAPPLKSSAIGDGICDCCDGSDEWIVPMQVPLCRNRCKNSNNDVINVIDEVCMCACM